MATKDNRSLWKRVKETIQTIKPIEPGSYRAQSLSIETQRENALNWLGNETHAERQKPEFAVDIPKHLLNDREFAAKLHERFGSEVADRVLPLEVKRSTEYQASTADSYQFLNAALQHDERSLQLEVKDYDKNFSQEDKQHAIDTVRRMGSAEALQFVGSLEQGADTNAAQKEALNAVSHEVLGDKEFLLCLDKLCVDLNNLPQHVKQSDALMTDCLEQSPAFFEVASTKVRSVGAYFERSMTNLDGNHEQAATNYRVAGERLKVQSQYFLSAHRESMGGISPRDVPESIRNDKDVIEELLKDEPNALRYASRELRRDKQFITDMTAKYKIDVSRDTLIKDREVALNLTKTDSVQLDKLPLELQQDREFVLNVVRLNGEQLKFASSDMRDDFEIALVAAQQGHLEGCSERLRGDPYIVSKAIEADPKSIEFASAEIRDTEAFGLLAVRANPAAIETLSERLRNSVEVAQAVIETDPAYTQFLGGDTRAKLIANLGQADREEYVYQFTEGQQDAASRAMSKGFEGMRATVEREALESSAPYAEAESYELSAQELAELRLNKVLSSESLTTQTDIAAWLDHYKVENYTINSDLTVDVQGDVDLKNKYTGDEFATDEYVGEQLSHTVIALKLSHIPFQFRKVDGNFDISNNGYDEDYMNVVGWRSLKGTPTDVGGTFDCSHNSNLSSLENGPQSVGGDYVISYTEVQDLSHVPELGGKIVAWGMPQLKEQVAITNERNTLSIGTAKASTLCEKINQARQEQGLPPVPPTPQKASPQVAAAPKLKQTPTFKI